MPRDVTITGADALRRSLRAFPAKLAKKSIRKALRAGAKTFAAEEKSEAPVRSGAMKRSVKIKAGKRKKDFIGMKVILPGGHPDDVPHFVEYGTKNQEANPFVLRSFERKESAVTGQILGDVARGAEELGL